MTGNHISIGGVVIATGVSAQAEPGEERQQRGAAIPYAYGGAGSSQRGSGSESLDEELRDYLANVQVGWPLPRLAPAGRRAGWATPGSRCNAGDSSGCWRSCQPRRRPS